MEYPEKSHRKPIAIPLESPELAEFIGIELGDGGINNPWQVVITVNSEADAGYAPHIANLIKTLFGIDVALRARKDKKALCIVASSTSLVEFLVSKGCVRGNKISQSICIPAWIRHDPSFLAPCIRGLVDTDGCLYIHSHKVAGREYRNLGLCFSSYSPQLLGDFADGLRLFGIKPYVVAGAHKVYLYSAKSVLRYLRVIGSSNPRIWNTYAEWESLA